MKIGDKIPELTLDSYHEKAFKKISLADYKGKWMVILFYPADFTFVCPTEIEDAADNYAEFKKEDAEIFTVSTDTNFAHKSWHDTSKAIGKVEFPMLADPTGKMCKAFGTYIDEDGHDDEGLSLRGTFIVNPDQEVIMMDVHDNSIGRNIQEILRKLQAAKFVYDNDGAIVCPAGWVPGDKTLKPGIDLVGKI
jgi:NADH-dependent peroxiredoxin subunit C